MKVDYSDLGMRIKRKREKMGMSQIELASRVGLSTQHISNVENARSRIGLDKLVAVANALECSVDELLCGSTTTSRSVYNDDIAEIIEDFSDTEIRVLPDFLKNFNYAYRLLKNEMEKKKDE